jgi:hypothetical protein
MEKRCLLWGKTCIFEHYLDKFQVWKDGRYSSWEQPCVAALMPRPEQSNRLLINPVKLHFVRLHIVSLSHARTPYCWFLWNYASNSPVFTVYCTNSGSSSLNNVMASFPPCSSPHTHTAICRRTQHRSNWAHSTSESYPEPDESNAHAHTWSLLWPLTTQCRPRRTMRTSQAAGQWPE